MAAPVEVTLGADPATGEGGVTVPVYPQRHKYITDRLGKFISELTESSRSTPMDNLLDVASEKSYALLSALIPNLSKRLPEWAFCGFPSREAADVGEYDPALDTSSPSIPEIRNAVKVASQVNGLDILTHVKGVFGLVPPTVVQAIISEPLMLVADLITEAMRSASTTSLSSPSASGDSPSTSSGTTPPTSTANGDSRSPVSTA
jgi:hypothetical protein